jgi:uncharacterized protein (TIGR03435 family)
MTAGTACLALTAALFVSQLDAQTLAFDVASVRQSKSDAPPSSNFPLGPGDVYTPNGGYFTAANWPLFIYIAFAWKIQGNQAEALRNQLPKWVVEDRFDIQARAEGNPTKDEMRLMMRSLLADRFKLAIHSETREVPVFGLVLAKAGRPGPQLRQHIEDAPCSTEPAKPSPRLDIEGGFPALCGGILGLPPKEPGHIRLGARNAKMSLIAEGLGVMGRLGRPVVDRTGLTGAFDFVIEFTPEFPNATPQVNNPEPAAPSLPFLDALREQLGLKVESQKGSVDVLVADHVERPSEN